jgi:glutaredoxin
MQDNQTQPHIDWRKYVITFFITATIFGTAIYTSNYFNNKRIDEIKSIQDSISTNIMSSETQVSLLSDLDCQDVGNSMLSTELNSLAEKIEYSEQNIGGDNKEVLQLKKFYSLLEIKDYLLMKRLSARCNKKFIFALYFYADNDKCKDCQKASHILTYLREQYPDLRVYSFDYNLDISALKTLISVTKVSDKLPAIVIDGHPIDWPQDKDSLEKLIKARYPKDGRTASSTKK